MSKTPLRRTATAAVLTGPASPLSSPRGQGTTSPAPARDAIAVALVSDLKLQLVKAEGAVSEWRSKYHSLSKSVTGRGGARADSSTQTEIVGAELQAEIEAMEIAISDAEAETVRVNAEWHSKHADEVEARAAEGRAARKDARAASAELERLHRRLEAQREETQLREAKAAEALEAACAEGRAAEVAAGRAAKQAEVERFSLTRTLDQLDVELHGSLSQLAHERRTWDEERRRCEEERSHQQHRMMQAEAAIETARNEARAERDAASSKAAADALAIQGGLQQRDEARRAAEAAEAAMCEAVDRARCDVITAQENAARVSREAKRSSEQTIREARYESEEAIQQALRAVDAARWDASKAKRQSERLAAEKDLKLSEMRRAMDDARAEAIAAVDELQQVRKDEAMKRAAAEAAHKQRLASVSRRCGLSDAETRRYWEASADSAAEAEAEAEARIAEARRMWSVAKKTAEEAWHAERESAMEMERAQAEAARCMLAQMEAERRADDAERRMASVEDELAIRRTDVDTAGRPSGRLETVAARCETSTRVEAGVEAETARFSHELTPRVRMKGGREGGDVVDISPYSVRSSLALGPIL